MRILFAGSPEVAIESVKAIHSSGNELVQVISQPARPVGRARTITATPVAVWAEAAGVPVATPESSEDLLQIVLRTKPDIAVVVAYGRILSPDVLEAVPGGWWNVHFSLLPQYRGAAPVQRALLAGETLTGVSLFRIVPELDQGPIFSAIEHPIAPHDTAGTLLNKLGARAPELLLPLLRVAATGSVPVSEQVGPSSSAGKLHRQDGFLDPRNDSASLYRVFQAVTPDPGALLSRNDTGGDVKVLRMWPKHGIHALAPGEVRVLEGELVMGCSPGAVVLDEVQPGGKRPMSGLEWFRGVPAKVVLGAPQR